jgi:DNA-binding TFAR19-related protein (PDSD5 family)
MSEEDSELKMIRRRKFLEMQRRLLNEQSKMSTEKQTEDPRVVLQHILVGRAPEVLEAARQQYPDVTQKLEQLLAKLVLQKKIQGKINGETLFGLFLDLGLRVRLETRIVYYDKGQVKTLAEKIKGE